MAQRTILIADADRDSREISATILRHAGYRTLEVANGESLLRDALARQPAAIVMELRLPGVDGHAVLARLRGRTRTTPIPILVLTTCTAAADRERAHRLGCDAYLIKPYRPRCLLAEVQWVLNEPPRSQSVRPTVSLEGVAAERAALRPRLRFPGGPAGGAWLYGRGGALASEMP